MKKLTFLVMVFYFWPSLYAEGFVIIPRQEHYHYAPNYYPYYPYDGYSLYEPYNGPMRGPNSIEGHKSFQERNRERLESGQFS